ncbi:MAG: hypothetical protein GY803_20980 [Chloroflexi bacterium]|nr:hypothetical protein [Chloroflexota bacterium]
MKKRFYVLALPPILAVIGLLAIIWLISPPPAYAIDHVVGGACGGTIQACIDFAAPGDTVIVPAGNYNESLTLSQPISLTGVSSATAIIQAVANQRVLTVTGAAIASDVVISGLTFTGGDVSAGTSCAPSNTTNCGGGILLTDSAQPSIQNVIIENNSAREGGGIYANETGGVYLDSVIIRNNTVLLSGGGLDARNTPVTITNSLFQENTTTDNVGGALSTGADFGIVAPVFISNTQFISNTAQCGSITCYAPGANTFDQDTTVVNSRFEGNECTRNDCDGGGLKLLASFNNPTLLLINTDFINNTAGEGGGGVSAGSLLAQMTVTNGRFQNNRALSGDGGGLAIAVGSASINGTQFISNSSALDGGGVYSRLDINIANASFERNSSGGLGGGLMIDFAGIGSNLSATDFLTNTAVGDGGGAYVFLNDLTVSGVSFSGNSSGGSGGGLRAGSNLTLTNVTVVSNTAVTNGGGVYANGGAVIVTGGRFERNVSQATITFFSEGGGGLYVANTASAVAINGTDFINNQAKALGGGALVQGTAVFTNGLFQGNTAVSSGGGLLNGSVFGGGSLNVNGTQFINNISGLFGGGVQVNGPADVRNALFQNNRASSGGGMDASDVVTIDNVQFLNNTAITLTGGGLDASTALTVTNSLFQENSSANNGGGLSSFTDPFILHNTQFLTNTALNGGGLSFTFNPIDAVDITIRGNHAISNGGGINTAGTATLRGNWEVSDNTAGEDGGGIWANSALNSVNGHIVNNTAVGSGGGYYGGLANMLVNGTEFSGNQAGGDGGGAHSFNALALGNALFEGNTANGAGGGLFLQRFVHITKTQFLGNAADLGGGLAVSRTNSGTLVQFVVNSVFARNTAATSGAGVYYNQPRPIDFIHNTFAQAAQAAGTAVHVAAGTVNITNTIIASFTTGIENAGGVVASNFNLFFGNNNDTTGAVASANVLVGNPDFVAAAGDDFRLVDGSIAIDSGIDAGVVDDIIGTARPRDAGFDRGAYEGRHTPTAVSLRQFNAATTYAWGWLVAVLLIWTLSAGLFWRRMVHL